MPNAMNHDAGVLDYFVFSLVLTEVINFLTNFFFYFIISNFTLVLLSLQYVYSPSHTCTATCTDITWRSCVCQLTGRSIRLPCQLPGTRAV